MFDCFQASLPYYLTSSYRKKIQSILLLLSKEQHTLTAVQENSKYCPLLNYINLL